ncbi:hypothetical protein GPALN_014361 [Globodera pallida]|nr:hypothetical protein GPALN_014361 [Globodera pallida]
MRGDKWWTDGVRGEAAPRPPVRRDERLVTRMFLMGAAVTAPAAVAAAEKRETMQKTDTTGDTTRVRDGGNNAGEMQEMTREVREARERKTVKYKWGGEQLRSERIDEERGRRRVQRDQRER